MRNNRLFVSGKVFRFSALLISFTLAACGGAKKGKKVVDDEDLPSEIQFSISPTAGTLAVSNTLQFEAKNAANPVSYLVLSGPASIDDSGLLTAGSDAGTVVVQAEDALSRTAQATITINPALEISPTSGTLAVNQVQDFSASGGVPPYSYSIVSGGGSILASSGRFTAPSAAADVVLRVTDSLLNTAEASVTVVDPVKIAPTTKTLAVGNSYTFGASGGVPPYVFALVSGGGAIDPASGQYMAPMSVGSAVVRVIDSLNSMAEATITINPALTMNPSSWEMMVLETKTFSAAGGVPPYIYSVTGGGGAIDPSSGLFTAPAQADDVSIQVVDSLGNTAQASVSVIASVEISPSPAYVLVSGSLTFTASGGDGDYTFSVVSGGGTIDPESGDYTAPPTGGPVVVQVMDGKGVKAQSQVTVYDELLINPSSVVLAEDNVFTFTATGGWGAKTFSVVSGGGVVDPITGEYQAPSMTGIAVVRVTDSLGNTSDADVTINGALNISPVTFKMATYSVKTFTVNNGVAPYSFAVVSGDGSVDPVTGVFTAGSTAGPVILRATDDLGNYVDAEIAVVEPVKVATGNGTACVVFNDGSLKCWGANGSGQLLIGNTTNKGDNANEMGTNLPFADLGAGRSVKDLSVGLDHVCAILDNDKVKCWGANSYGQLGYGDTSGRGGSANTSGDNLPYVDLGTNRTAKKVFAGHGHTCAILDDDSAKCWGRNNQGQLGLGDKNSRGDGANEMGDELDSVNLGSGRTVKAMALGSLHTCAILDNNTAKCWGRNNYGQLALGNTTTRGDNPNEMGNNLATINLGTNRTAKAVVAGVSHTCFLLNNDQVKCWGRSNQGQLGYGNTNSIGDSSSEVGDSVSNVSLGSGLSVLQISSTHNHNCVKVSTNLVKCWGRNNNGQLGIGNTNSIGDGSNEMGDQLAVADLGGEVESVSAGRQFNCALMANKRVKCWGGAGSGALGNGSTNSHRGDGANEMGDQLPYIDL